MEEVQEEVEGQQREEVGEEHQLLAVNPSGLRVFEAVRLIPSEQPNKEMNPFK